jgi:acyl-CoA synthetase (AMP-forming)/AMP-acid ligase II
VAGVEIRIIRETERALDHIAQAEMCAPGEVGEIIATGPSVTQEYDHLPAASRLAKIREGDRLWHRMGDLGTLDVEGRLFFLGRKVEKVRTADGDLPTELLEPAFRQHPQAFRCALIGLGAAPHQTVALVVEPRAGHFPETEAARTRFIAELRDLARINPQADRVKHIVFQRALPVDVRHNAKIHRLQLAHEWTARLAR